MNSYIKNISSICLIFIIMTQTEKAEAQWSVKNTFVLENVDMIHSALYLASGNEILITDNKGNLLKINSEDGEVVWQKFIATPDNYMSNSDVILLAVSHDGELAAISERQWNGAGPSYLHIYSVNSREKLYSIRENSNYYFKYYENKEDLRCPGVNNSNPKDNTCVMHPYFAAFTSNGNLITAWENYASTFGLYDRSFKFYSASFKKIWDWQVVSDVNPQERAGFFHSLPAPVITEISEGKYIYGDCEIDIRTLTRQKIEAIKSVNVATQVPGEIFQKSSLAENAGISNIILIDKYLYVFAYESGGQGYYAVFDISTKKPVVQWTSSSSAYRMAVNKSGTRIALNGSGCDIFEALTGNKEFYIDRADFVDFNPNNENELFSTYGNEITIYKKD